MSSYYNNIKCAQREAKKSCHYTKHALQTCATLYLYARTANRSKFDHSKLVMQRNLQEDFDEAKSKIGESLILAGVEIKGLELQNLKSIVPGTSTKHKNSYFKWKFQLVGAKKTFWQRITYDVYIDFHHRHPFTRKLVLHFKINSLARL